MNSDAVSEDEEKYSTSVVIKCWFIIVKNLKDSAMREKLFEIMKLLNDFLEQETAIEYIEIFMKYLANTDNQVTRTDAVKAVEAIFPERGADMVKGWAKEYVDQGMQQGMLTEARQMVLEALDIKFSSNIPQDVFNTINIVNNRVLLKNLLGSAILSKDIEGFRKALQEIPPEQMQ